MTQTENQLQAKVEEPIETEILICDAQVRSFLWAFEKIDAVFEEARASL